MAFRVGREHDAVVIIEIAQLGQVDLHGDAGIVDRFDQCAKVLERSSDLRQRWQRSECAFEHCVRFTVELWQRVQSTVAASLASLKAYGETGADRKRMRTFRDSVVDNLRSQVEWCRKLNLSADTELETYLAKVEHDLCFYEPEDLRKHESIRDDVVQKAETILAGMSAYTGAAE